MRGRTYQSVMTIMELNLFDQGNSQVNWNIVEAEQKFPELLRAVTEEPQCICNQGKRIAVLVNAEVYREFLEWRRHKQTTSLADAFTNLRALCAEEDYSLELPARQNRPNLFVHDLGEIPL